MEKKREQIIEETAYSLTYSGHGDGRLTSQDIRKILERFADRLTFEGGQGINDKMYQDSLMVIEFPEKYILPDVTRARTYVEAFESGMRYTQPTKDLTVKELVDWCNKTSTVIAVPVAFDNIEDLIDKLTTKIRTS